MKKWHSITELKLVCIAFPLELLWEVAQLPLFTIWHEEAWTYNLYALIHCTLGDLVILLGAYWLVAVIFQNRHWYKKTVYRGGMLFIAFGLIYTVYSEYINVSIRGSWEYTELMPIVPVVNIGAMPFLQWLLIPPVILWLMRQVNDYFINIE